MDQELLRRLVSGDEADPPNAVQEPCAVEGSSELTAPSVLVVATEAPEPHEFEKFMSDMSTPFVDRSNTMTSKVLWNLEDLYKKNVQGSIRMWRVGCEAVRFADDRPPQVFVRTEYGIVGGKVTVDRNEVQMNRSGRSLEGQAWIQSRQKWREMWRDDGYRFYKNVVDADTNPLDASESRPLPAKATLWKAGEIERDVYPVAAQAKLDGHRMLARMTAGDVVVCRTCNNREHTHLTSIKEALAKFFEFLPPGTELDGEIFTPDLTFQQLSSAIRNERKQTEAQTLLKYYIFDIVLDHAASETLLSSSASSSRVGSEIAGQRALGVPFELRYNLLLGAYLSYQQTYPSDKLVFVLSHLLYNDNEVDLSMQRYVQEKYEGVILRKVWLSRSDDHYAGSLYHTDRSRHMFKHKPFRDEEGRVVGVSDASGREAGAALLQVETREGKLFTLRMVGSLERRRLWLQNPALVVGKQVTYRFQDKTDSGLPRFPRGIEIRDYE